MPSWAIQVPDKSVILADRCNLELKLGRQNRQKLLSTYLSSSLSVISPPSSSSSSFHAHLLIQELYFLLTVLFSRRSVILPHLSPFPSEGRDNPSKHCNEKNKQDDSCLCGSCGCVCASGAGNAAACCTSAARTDAATAMGPDQLSPHNCTRLWKQRFLQLPELSLTLALAESHRIRTDGTRDISKSECYTLPVSAVTGAYRLSFLGLDHNTRPTGVTTSRLLTTCGGVLMKRE